MLVGPASLTWPDRMLRCGVPIREFQVVMRQPLRAQCRGCPGRRLAQRERRRPDMSTIFASRAATRTEGGCDRDEPATLWERAEPVARCNGCPLPPCALTPSTRPPGDD